MNDEAREDSYIVVYYADGELNSKTFSNNPEAAEFLENMANDSHGEFDPYIHSVVIKTEKDKHSILSVQTTETVKVSVGGY